MNLIHFHVDRHDVGYMPDTDPMVYESIDGALEGVWDLAEQHIEYCLQVIEEDPDLAVRGQINFADDPDFKPWTFEDEVADVERQVNEFKAKISTDPTYTEEIANNGLLIVLDAGIAVIELSPCVEDVCEEYREDWGD